LERIRPFSLSKHPLLLCVRNKYNEWVLCLKKQEGDETKCYVPRMYAKSMCPGEWVSEQHQPSVLTSYDDACTPLSTSRAYLSYVICETPGCGCYGPGINARSMCPRDWKGVEHILQCQGQALTIHHERFPMPFPVLDNGELVCPGEWMAVPMSAFPYWPITSGLELSRVTPTKPCLVFLDDIPTRHDSTEFT
jgi:hypothetical protein